MKSLFAISRHYFGPILFILVLSCQSETNTGTLILSDNMPIAWEYSTSTILEDGRRERRDTTVVVFLETISKQEAGFIDNDRIISPIWRVYWINGMILRLFETDEGLYLAHSLDDFESATLYFPRRYEIGVSWKYSTDSWLVVIREEEITIGNQSYSTVVIEGQPHGGLFYWSPGIGLVKHINKGSRDFLFPPELIIYVSEFIRAIPR